MTYKTLDLGIKKPVYKLGNRVWYDDNNNGLQNKGETGVEGVKVTLIKPDGTKDFTTTDIYGHYEFEGLENGDYKVEFSNLPGGYKPTLTNVGTNDLIDSDGLTPNATIANADNPSVDLGMVCIPVPSLPKTGSSSSSLFRDLGILIALAGALLILRKEKVFI